MTPISDHPQRRQVRIAGGLFAGATAIVIAVITVDRLSAGAASVLLGPLDDQIILSTSMLVASLALVAGLWNVSPPTWMLPFKILGLLGAVVTVLGAGVFTLFSIDVSRTTLIEGGCDTGYVVVERTLLFGSKGTVYQQEGLFIASPMGRTSGDDAHEPFAEGDYTVTTTDGTLTIEYGVDRGGPTATLSLPAIVDRVPSCGYAPTSLDTPPGSTEPTTPTEVLTPTSVDAAIDQLLDDSLTAAAGTPVDASGTPIDASTAERSLVPCVDGSGVQHHVDLELRTDDNATSVAQILGVWDDAGYAPDRAMQEDIRYSETGPVARLTMRDTTSIDGFVRMTITSACVPTQ